MTTFRRTTRWLPTMCGWVLAMGSVTLAEVINVPGDFATIQSAIDAADDGDEVVVAAGTYHETIDLLGKAIIVRSSDGPTATIIDAQQAGNVVICHNGEGSDTVLEGFTITGGFSDRGDLPGAGMHNYSTNPTIINCVFSDNLSYAAGGGMYNEFSDPTLINCVFRGNCVCGDLGSNLGGGMYNYESSPTLVNCVFSGNEAAINGDGGAIYNNESSPTLINCVLSGNVAGQTGRGGAIYNDYYSSRKPTLINCTLVGNTAFSPVGGGIFGEATATNCIFWDNEPDQAAHGVATITYSNVQGGYTGTGNIDQSPLFADAFGPDGHYGTDDDDLRLLPGSPCVDGADNDALPPDAFDLDGDGDTTEPIPFDLVGHPRLAGQCGEEPPFIVDMGAYEAQDEDCNGNGTADSCDIAEGTSEDCSANGVPDECEPDCNDNEVADSCDVVEGTSEDCNGNAVPDECDVAGNGQDCNSNEIPDACDIAAGTSEDCNGNGWPDECDLASGTSQDCQGNGIPDECDPLFLENSITTDADQAYSVFAADMDGDGDIDALSASFADDKIAWYENTDGRGSFGPQRIITTSANGARSVVAADVDGDGDYDVLSASFWDNKIAWYENTDGLGSFGPEQIITTAANRALSVFAADLDGDGDTDVLSASSDDDKIAWYENTDGLGNFGPQQIISTTANGAWSVFAADLDGDGDADVLSASKDDDKIAWYENTDGLGSFGPQQIITTAANGAQSVFAADLDGDGDSDALSASFWDDKIAWYENTDGLGSFGPQQIISSTAYFAWSVFAADLSGDGDIDVLSAAGSTIAWYENTDGLGSFGPRQTISSAASGARSVFAADLDGDGDSDALSASYSDDKIAWYENPNDCNGNGVLDACDIIGGTSPDCTGNGIPDECEPDCNDNGVADSCDIAAGTSADGNGDDIPDECQEFCLTHDDCDDNIDCTIDFCNIVFVCEYLDILCLCEGDANGDGIVDPLDHGFVLSRFGCPVGTGDPDCDAADQNGDGVVDPLDIGFVLARFGECP